MARTAVTVTALAYNTALARPAGTNADTSNGHSVAVSGPATRLLLVVKHTASGAKNLTVKAGDASPADAQGQGDLVVAFAAGNVTAVEKVITVTSDRFIQNDGTISIDLESGFTGTIAAIQLPKE